MLKWLLMLALPIMVSCGGFSKISNQGYKEIVYPDGSKFIQSVDHTGVVKTPPNAKDTGSITSTPDGISTAVPGNWERQAVDYARSNYYIFYIASVIFIGAGLVAMLWLRQYILGGTIAGVGAGLAFMPSIIDAFAPVVIWVLVGVLIFGLSYGVGKWVQLRVTQARNKPAIVKLRKEGKVKEAEAIQRAIDPAIDDAYKNLTVAKPPT